MIIREATQSDAKQLSDLSVKTYVHAFGSPFSNPLDLEKWIEETRSEKYFKKIIEKGSVLVAEEDGVLIGYAEFGKIGVNYPIKDKAENDQILSRLFVLDEYQNKGIGKALLDKMLACKQMQMAGKIYLDVSKNNEGAQRLYKSYGFEDTGQIIDGDMIMVRQNQ